MADRIVKVGVIGCGGIANQKHLPSLHKLPNVQLVAFCDIIVEKAEKLLPLCTRLSALRRKDSLP